jgi:hypothetical protein
LCRYVGGEASSHQLVLWVFLVRCCLVSVLCMD